MSKMTACENDIELKAIPLSYSWPLIDAADLPNV